MKYWAITGNAGGELGDYIPTPKGTTTLHSLVTNEHPGQFHGAQKPACQLPQGLRVKAIGRTIGQALEVTYTNHNYTVGGAIH